MNAPTVRLADVAEINPRLKVRPAADEPVAFLGMADVDATDGKTTPGGKRPFASVAKGYTPFLDGDLLVAKITPCFENGKIAQANLHLPVGMGSTEFHVIRPKPGVLDARYALQLLRTPAVRAAGERRMTGSGGQRRVPANFLQSLPVSLPSLDEQRRIADILDRADALRTRRRQTSDLLDDLAASVHIDMFGDPHTNPMGWLSAPLGDLARVIRGASPRPAGDPRYFGGPIPWLKISDITASPGLTVSHIKEGVTEAGRDRSVLLKTGSLILTNSATVGIPKFLGVDACIHDGFLALLDLDPRVNSVFLYFSLLLRRKHLAAMAPQGTQKNLNTGIAKALSISVPPRHAQDAFVTTMERLGVARRSAELHRSQTDALIAALQHRAFRGEL
ncbi:restriction endonuclease subunit S [Modestobacter lapidis]|nr:hypothetical protein [Modestobacter lapidis]